MSKTVSDKCGATNKATCRKHGWIKHPISGPEAETVMVAAGHRMQSAHGTKSLFREAENTYRQAVEVYNGTPEGQKKLKSQINLMKRLGGNTIRIKENLDKAKYERAIQEASFKIDGFFSEVEENQFPNLKSDKGEKLVEKLEKIKGSKVSENTWGEAIEGTRSALTVQAAHRYRKSFANRLTVDLKDYGMAKKQVSKANNEFVIKNKKGDHVATVFFNEDGKSLNKAVVPLAGGFGATKDIKDGTDFRIWLEANKKL